MSGPVKKVESWRLFSWESLIDAGLGTPEMLAWQARQDADREARRRSLPLRFRARQRLLRTIAAAAGALATWAERQHDRVHVAPDAACRLCQTRDR